MKYFSPIVFLLLLLAACTPATMNLDSAFSQRNSAMPVRGRQGWQLNQTLSYGAFYTSPITRGWTFSYHIPFIVSFKGAHEKLGFQQFNGAGQKADVYLLNTLRNDELPLLNDFFSLTIIDESVLVGSIATEAHIWDFLVFTPSYDLKTRRYEGFVSSDSAYFSVTEVKNYAETSLHAPQALGFEFRTAGQLVGAVETINGGRVWLEANLPEEQRLVLASAASALLLRANLTEVF